MNHPLAWLIWALAAAMSTLLTRNPLYLAIIALAAWLVQLAAGQQAAIAPSWRRLGLWGVAVWLIALPVATLTSHQGRHILWRLPAGWPLIGGPATVEGIATGVALGLLLWTLLLILIALYSALPATPTLRLPLSLRRVEPALAVVLAFLPEMLRQIQRITEAQRLRGRRLANGLDRPSILWPALCATIAHSRCLAEALVSRSSTGPRSHYRRAPWNKSDSAIVALSALAAIGIGMIRVSDRVALAYSATTDLRPEFNAWVGVLLTLLALPGLIALFGETGLSVGEPAPARDTS